MELGSISKLLSGSQFADHAKEIEAMFDKLGIKTLNDLDNAPARLGMRVYGYSAFKLCAYLRNAAIYHVMHEPEIELLEPEPEAEPEPEPEPEELEPEERSDE